MSNPRSGSTAHQRREVYEVEEIRRIIKKCPKSPSGARDKFVVMLLWCSGLKTAELLSLRPGDYTRSSVKAGAREIVIPPSQRDRLEGLHDEWIGHRKSIAQRRSPLICNLTGGALDSSYVRHTLAALSELAKLGKRLNVQGLRNTFAASMHHGKTPLELIQQQLGHADLEYTASYVALVSERAEQLSIAKFRL